MADFHLVGAIEDVAKVKTREQDIVPNFYNIDVKVGGSTERASFSTSPKKGADPTPERIAQLKLAMDASMTGEIIRISGYTSEKETERGTKTYYNGTKIEPYDPTNEKHAMGLTVGGDAPSSTSSEPARATQTTATGVSVSQGDNVAFRAVETVWKALAAKGPVDLSDPSVVEVIGGNALALVNIARDVERRARPGQ